MMKSLIVVFASIFLMTLGCGPGLPSGDGEQTEEGSSEKTPPKPPITKFSLQILDQAKGVYTAEADLSAFLDIFVSEAPVKIHVNHSGDDNNANAIVLVERQEASEDGDNIFCTHYKNVDVKTFENRMIVYSNDKESEDKEESMGEIDGVDSINELTVLPASGDNNEGKVNSINFGFFKSAENLLKTEQPVASYSELVARCENLKTSEK